MDPISRRQILAATAAAFRHGILVKGSIAIERFSAVQTMIFDKTGTLTMGEPQVEKIESFSKSHSEDDILALAAMLEDRVGGVERLGGGAALVRVGTGADELAHIVGGHVNRDAREAWALPSLSLLVSLDLLAGLEINGRIEALDGAGDRRTRRQTARHGNRERERG